MWLNVHTSKRPEVILPFYLGAAEKHGCPDVIVADHGPESALIAYVNLVAKRDWEQSSGQAVDRPAVHWTKSVHNQPVEKFWIEPNTRIT
jgi:hypothetical protein